MHYIGCDPGTTGAICSLTPSTKSITFFNTPDVKALHRSIHVLINALPTGMIVTRVAIEDVHSMGGMNAKSNFQFGRNLGHLEVLIHFTFSRVEYIQPKAWQKACGIKFEYPKKATAAQKSKIRKETTAKRCIELYPKAEIYGPRGGLMDGRADALMIAHALSLSGDDNGIS